jgi:hypothetical protein
MELEVWSLICGAPAVEVELRSWSCGAPAVELELWSNLHICRAVLQGGSGIKSNAASSMNGESWFTQARFITRSRAKFTGHEHRYE